MQESRSHLIVLGLVVAVLAAVFWVGYTTPIKLGLDLQGGVEVVLKASPKTGDKVTTEQLDKSVKVIRKRVDSIGATEPEIRTQGTDQIAIALPGIKDVDNAVQVVGSTAQLRFYDFNERLKSGGSYRDPYRLLDKYRAKADKSLEQAQTKLDKAQVKVEAADSKQVKAAAKNDVKRAGFDVAYYLFDEKHKLVAGPAPDQARLLQDHDGKLPKGWKFLHPPIGQIMVRGAPDFLPPASGGGDKGRFDREQGVYLLLQDKPGLLGDEIRQGNAETSGGGWVTSILFTRKGGRQFGDVTEEIARRGALLGQVQSFAIVLDDEIKSTPTIDYKDYPSGIKGNSAQITGLDDRQEADNLALVLNSGSLPVRFEIISKTQVSATLGKQSLTQGLYAGAAGLLVVMVYLVLFYRFLGFIADLALLAYAGIFYGLIVGIPVTMTLPGIAGMILTIGVAADANIIIFERIREEYRAGRTVRAAISAGYGKGLRTIVDANMVTLITALVLFVIAAGSVKGFALLLGLGTMLSMFTAVAATFAMLGLLGASRIFRHPFVIGGSRKPLRFHVQWMSLRRVMLGFTATVVVASLLLLSGLVPGTGLNLGIDFKSGTEFDVVLAKKVDASEVAEVMRKVDPDYRSAVVQGKHEPTAGGEAAPSDESAFSIRVEKLAAVGKGEGKNAQERANSRQQQAEARVKRALDDAFGIKHEQGSKEDGKEAFSVQTIGPSFGRQVLGLAIVAVIVSLLLEVCYIWMRFEAKYTIPVIIALVHDMVVAMGAYAIVGWEFKSTTVAALLTILGYSLYDTIIVFDRVRENVGVMRKSSFSRIIDRSLNEVITRSLNTTLVVLLPISALLVFGGETLTDFAFALMVGIFAGAYSSIVVASPILCLLKEREPAWQRRMGMEGGGGGGVVARGVTPGATPGNSDRGARPLAPEAGGNGAAGSTTSTTGPSDATGDADVATGEDAIGAAPIIVPQGRRDRRSRAQRRK